MHIFNVFMLHQVVKTCFSLRARLSHMSSARDPGKGFYTFKGLADVLFLFKGEGAAPFCRATRCNQAVLAGRQPGSSPGPGSAGFGHFLIYSFIYIYISHACLPGE